jgi:hypothetical protein
VARRGRPLYDQESCGGCGTAAGPRGRPVDGRSDLPQDVEDRPPVRVGRGREDREDAYLGIPFWGEEVRFTLQERPTETGSRTFSFGTMMTKRTTNEIVDYFGESEGVKVEREAGLKIVRP